MTLAQLPEAVLAQQLKMNQEKLQSQQAVMQMAQLVLPQLLSSQAAQYDPQMQSYLQHLFKRAGLPTSGLITNQPPGGGMPTQQPAQAAQPMQPPAQTAAPAVQPAAAPQQPAAPAPPPASPHLLGGGRREPPPIVPRPPAPKQQLPQAVPPTPASFGAPPPGAPQPAPSPTGSTAVNAAANMSTGFPATAPHINLDALLPKQSVASATTADIDALASLDPKFRGPLLRSKYYDAPAEWYTLPRQPTATEINTWTKGPYDAERARVLSGNETPEQWQAFVKQNHSMFDFAFGTGAADAALNDPTIKLGLGAKVQYDLAALAKRAPFLQSQIELNQKKMALDGSQAAMYNAHAALYSQDSMAVSQKTAALMITANAKATAANAALERAQAAVNAVGVAAARNNVQLYTGLLKAKSDLNAAVARVQSAATLGGTEIPSDFNDVMDQFDLQGQGLDAMLQQLKPGGAAPVSNHLKQLGVQHKAPTAMIPKNAVSATGKDGSKIWYVPGSGWYSGTPGGQGTLAPGQQ